MGNEFGLVEGCGHVAYNEDFKIFCFFWLLTITPSLVSLIKTQELNYEIKL